MKLDTTVFPLVTMNYNSESEGSIELVLHQIRKLLDKQQPFVFIGRGTLGNDSQSTESVDDRRKITLWMKENKIDILRFIKANIHIVPDINKQVGINDFSVTFERFWGDPLFVVTTELEAYNKAKMLLKI